MAMRMSDERAATTMYPRLAYTKYPATTHPTLVHIMPYCLPRKWARVGSQVGCGKRRLARTRNVRRPGCSIFTAGLINLSPCTALPSRLQ